MIQHLPILLFFLWVVFIWWWHHRRRIELERTVAPDELKARMRDLDMQARVIGMLGGIVLFGLTLLTSGTVGR